MMAIKTAHRFVAEETARSLERQSIQWSLRWSLGVHGYHQKDEVEKEHEERDTERNSVAERGNIFTV